MLDCLHYCDTGICEASYNEIAEAASAARSTVAVAIRAARRAGLLRVIGTTKGGRNKRNKYVFTYNGADVTNQTVFEGERNSPNGGLFKKRNSPNDDSKQSEIASQTVRRSDDSSLNPYDSLKGKKGEGEPLPLGSAASPSPKKANGLQQSELEEKAEREANLAKLAETAASLKQMGVKTDPKPPPRINGPVRYKATEADKRLFQLQADGFDVDEPPKPAPIVLVAERFDNVSQFPSVTGNVEPPSFPELPGFLEFDGSLSSQHRSDAWPPAN